MKVEMWEMLKLMETVTWNPIKTSYFLKKRLTNDNKDNLTEQ